MDNVHGSGSADNLHSAGSQAPPSSSEPLPPEVAHVERRVIAGLQEGRIVNYVMADKRLRPLLIVNANDRCGFVDGVLFFNGTADDRIQVVPLRAGPHGHVPEHSVLLRAVAFDVTGVEPTCSDPAMVEGMKPGTWHWPNKQPVMASGVDPNAVETMVMSVVGSLQSDFRAEITSLVNAKLQASVESVRELLDTLTVDVAQRAKASVEAIDTVNLPSSSDVGTESLCCPECGKIRTHCECRKAAPTGEQAANPGAEPAKTQSSAQTAS